MSWLLTLYRRRGRAYLLALLLAGVTIGARIALVAAIELDTPLLLTWPVAMLAGGLLGLGPGLLVWALTVFTTQWLVVSDFDAFFIPRALSSLFSVLFAAWLASALRKEQAQATQSEQRLRELNQHLEERVAQRSAEAVRRAEQLRLLTHELIQAEERERRRLAQVLHDHVQQMLVAARMRAAYAMDNAASQEQHDELEQVILLLDESVQASRSLTSELSPTVLYQSGLGAALQWLSAWMKDKHGMTVEVDADPRAEPASQEHKILLFRAARELLFNAVKHSGVKAAKVTLRYLEGLDNPEMTQGISLAVADAGRGFSPQEAQWRESKGGFGLFSLRERSAMLGGEMTIDSAPGQGCRITLVIPLKLAPAAPPPMVAQLEERQPLPARQRRPGPVRVLLTDDHKLFREGLRSLLERESGIEVVGEASNGKAAVAQAAQLRPDVVLMDGSLPDISGIEATRRIIEQAPGARVIGLSMHLEGDIAAAMLRAGAEAYLTKDGPADELIAAIIGPSAKAA